MLSLRQDDDGQWRLDGGGGGGPAPVPVPVPVPVTTIAWRLGHLGGMAVGGFASRRFGTLTAAQVGFPSRAAAVPGFLDEHYRNWRSGLAGLSPAQWAAPLGPSWGPYTEANTVDLALHVLDEVIHHGAEVGLLRDRYSRRSGIFENSYE